MSEIGRNANKAWDAGYAAAFHFGMALSGNPYKARYARNCWANGWREGMKDKTQSVMSLLAKAIEYHDKQMEA